MAQQTAVTFLDVFDKVTGDFKKQTGQNPDMIVDPDDTLGRYLSGKELMLALTYLAAYYGCKPQELIADIGENNTIEDLYNWLVLRQRAAGVPPMTYLPAEETETRLRRHQKVLGGYQNRWCLQEEVNMRQAVLTFHRGALEEKRAAFAQEKRGCTSWAVGLTILLLIPAAWLLGGTARKVVVALLLLHLVLSLVFRIWDLNGADQKKWKAEISEMEKSLEAEEREIQNCKTPS